MALPEVGSIARCGGGGWHEEDLVFSTIAEMGEVLLIKSCNNCAVEYPWRVGR